MAKGRIRGKRKSGNRNDFNGKNLMSKANFDESGKLKIHSFGDFIKEHNKKYYEEKIDSYIDGLIIGLYDINSSYDPSDPSDSSC